MSIPLILAVVLYLFSQSDAWEPPESRARGANVPCSVACETDTLKLRCWNNDKIHIEYVFWGKKIRRSSYGCQGGSGYQNCEDITKQEAVKEVVLDSCENEKECQVPATRSNLGDPCNIIAFYELQVCYHCLFHVSNWTRPSKKPNTSKPSTAVTTTMPTNKQVECEELPKDSDTQMKKAGGTLDIECDEDESIDITLAVFGKRLKKCSDDTIRIANTGSRSKTFKTVYNKCQGRQKCKVPVKPRHFGGRRTRGTFLQVAFECSDRELQGNVKNGVLKCKHEHQKIFLNTVPLPQCAKYLEKTCQRHRKCNAQSCQLKYSCQKPKKYNYKHGKHGGTHGGGGGSGEDDSASHESNSGSSGESEESGESDGSDSSSSEVHIFIPPAPGPVPKECSYQFYNGKWYATGSTCPKNPTCSTNPNGPGCGGAPLAGKGDKVDKGVVSVVDD